MMSSSQNGAAGIPPTVNGCSVVPSTTQGHLLSHYLHNVLPIQYLLVDASSITDFAASLVHNSPSARDTACMLSVLHLTTMRGSQMDQSAVTTIYQ